MNFKKNGGFTLVELIVVIAILGILAGIGIPAYGKYVEKTQVAVEEQNINMFHNAYVVAMVGNGIDPEGHTPTLNWKGDAFYGLTGISAKGTKTPQELARDEFNTFFGFDGTKSYSFKHHSQTEVADGIKNGLDGETIKVAYGGGNISFNKGGIEALKKTTFFEKLGTEGLLDKVSDTVAYAALMGNDSAMQKVYESEAFIEHAASALGVDTSKEGWEDEAYAKIDAMTKQVAERDGITWDAAYEQVRANAAVIHAAKNASEMNTNDVISMLTGDNATAQIQANLNTDPSKALSEAALAYGMYTAYVYNKGNQDLIDGSSDALTVLKNLNDPGFKEYMATEQAKTDLEGYMTALGMINESSKDTDAVSTLLVNGFNDPDLAAALGSVLDK